MGRRRLLKRSEIQDLRPGRTEPALRDDRVTSQSSQVIHISSGTSWRLPRTSTSLQPGKRPFHGAAYGGGACLDDLSAAEGARDYRDNRRIDRQRFYKMEPY